MNSLTAKQLAKHLRDSHLGGNWTGVSLKQLLQDVSFSEAVTRVSNLNSICDLVFHTHYYIHAQLEVMTGGILTASDAQSFTYPPVKTLAEWKQLQHSVFEDMESLAAQIEELDEETLQADFTDAKYGNYLRNLWGAVEHCHYHFGQIAILKKLLRS